MTYNIDNQHTTVQFKVRHMMIANVRGVFAKVSGSVTYDEAAPAKSSLEVSIESGSVSTPDADRNAHLKGADFFDAEKHPAITFKSKSVAASGAGFNVTGDLSLHGVTKQVTMAVSDRKSVV